jgi:hypothetical protein
MKQRSKLSPEQAQESAQTKQTGQRQTAREFATAEELLRFDAEQTAVPPELAERVRQSSAELPPPPKRSWWKNLFGQ